MLTLATLRRRVRGPAKEVLYALVRFCGLARVVHVLVGRRRVGILVYHHPRPEVLDRHLSYLRKVGNLIPLDTLVEGLERHDFSRIPPRSVVVTIDDGHRSNRELLDVLVKHRVVPTIFLCTEIVGTRRRFWWTVLDPSKRQSLMRVPNAERELRLREDFGFAREDEAETRQALSLEELAEITQFTDLEPHTRSHPILPLCDEAECREEIAGSKRDLERLLGRPCRHFAYPNGAHGEREVELVRAAGFASARTIEHGWNGIDADPYRLKVLGIDDSASINALAAHLAGIGVLRDLLCRSRRATRLPNPYGQAARPGRTASRRAKNTPSVHVTLDVGHAHSRSHPPRLRP